MKEKTKQLKAEISKSLAAITEIGGQVEKKSIRKKITALAEDFRKLLKKDAKKKEKEAAKAEKKAAKAEKKGSKGEEKSKKPQAKQAAAPAEEKKEAAASSDPVKNLKAEVWKTSSKE